MKIVDILFPQTIKCFVCGKEINNFGACEECYPKLPFITGKTCDICGGRMIGESSICDECKNNKYYFAKNYSIFEYSDDMQKGILSFKSGRKYLGNYFSDIIRNYILKNKLSFDIIIPVPIHKNRRKERGFNQSEILVESLKDIYTVDKDVMTRTKDTPHQTGLNRENRISNLENAFEIVNKDKIKNKVILLIDDIYTTGSTLNECSKTLLEAQSKEIICLCLARTPVDNGLEKE